MLSFGLLSVISHYIFLTKESFCLILCLLTLQDMPCGDFIIYACGFIILNMTTK